MKKVVKTFLGIMFLFVIFSWKLSSGNQKSTAYILFCPEDTTTYDASVVKGLSEKRRMYQKIVNQVETGELNKATFLIWREMFEYNSSQHSIDTLHMSQMEKVEYKTIQEALEDYADSGYILKDDPYEKTFIIEPIDKGRAISYEVDWITYEE